MEGALGKERLVEHLDVIQGLDHHGSPPHPGEEPGSVPHRHILEPVDLLPDL